MKKALLLFVFWALLLYAFAYVSSAKTNFDYAYEEDAITVDPPAALWHLANFDGAHYQNIARWGYIARFQTAFFPLYPLLTHFLGAVGGNFLFGGLLISFLAALGCVLLLYRLAGLSAVILLLTFPTSFFLLTSYTESLFLFLTLLAWWFYQKKKYLHLGLTSALTSATRFYGLFLFPVILLDYFLSKKRHLFLLWPLLFLPLGLIAYSYYLSLNFGDYLSFFHGLALWQKSNLIFPLQTLYRYLKIFLTVSPALPQYWIAFLEFAAFWIGLAVSFYYLFRRRLAFSFLLFLGVVIPATTGTLQSLPRYLLALFPLFLLPVRRTLLTQALLLGSLLLQLFLFTRFLSGFFVS